MPSHPLRAVGALRLHAGLSSASAGALRMCRTRALMGVRFGRLAQDAGVTPPAPFHHPLPLAAATLTRETG
jgi:hypothetical protein